jgi:hypothetical protein
MSRSAGWTFAVLSSGRGVNNLAITPCVTDARHASRASRVKRAVGLERTPNQYGVQTQARHSASHLAGTPPAHFISWYCRLASMVIYRATTTRTYFLAIRPPVLAGRAPVVLGSTWSCNGIAWQRVIAYQKPGSRRSIAPDGEADFDGEKAQAARSRRRARRA